MSQHQRFCSEYIPGLLRLVLIAVGQLSSQCVDAQRFWQKFLIFLPAAFQADSIDLTMSQLVLPIRGCCNSRLVRPLSFPIFHTKRSVKYHRLSEWNCVLFLLLPELNLLCSADSYIADQVL